MIQSLLKFFTGILKKNKKPMKRIESQKILEDFGPCCATGEEGANNLIFLPLKLPEEMLGWGWGCNVCQLPELGAIAVITDYAKENNIRIKEVIAGDPLKKERLNIHRLNEAFEHDDEAHKFHETFINTYSSVTTHSNNANEYGLVEGMVSGVIYLMNEENVAVIHRMALHSKTPLPLDNAIEKIKQKGLEPWFVEPRDLVRTKLIERGFVRYNENGIITWRPQ